LPTQKIVLKEILEFYKVSAKGLFWNLGYAYILSGCRDRIRVENIHSFAFFCARRRWTAIGVGAFRAHPAIGSLSPAIVSISTTFLYNAQGRAPFCTRALLVHIFVVRVLLGHYLTNPISRDEYY
jgi:hypothetical protein